MHDEQFQEAPFISALIASERANLVAALEYAGEYAGGRLGSGVDADRTQEPISQEMVVIAAATLESLLSQLGESRAVARVVAVRQRAQQAIQAWTRARYRGAVADWQLVFDSGRISESVALARQLVERAVGAGETAYPGSGFDIAEAHHLLARSLQMSGDCRAALPIVEEAWQRFQREAASSNEESSYIEDSCLTTLADCLASMGCFDEAAGIYEATIEHARGRGDLRNVAVGKFQLGSVLMQQKRHENALVAFRAALEILTTLQERPMIGSAWHQIGMAHRKLDQFEAAEKAYQNALRLLVSVPNRRNEALTLIELGNLYAAWGRQEDAVSFSHKAAEILVRPGIEDLASEGSARLNAASSLCELQRYDEARREISRAIECNEPFGHTTRPWIAYDVLSRLELATGDALAAASARARAMAAYLAYRRDGGDGIARFAPSCASAEMVLNGQPDEVPAQLRDLDALGSSPELNAESKAFVAALSAILRGAREPAIAQSTDLHYLDSAELLLLLERLESAKLTQQQIEEPTEASSS